MLLWSLFQLYIKVAEALCTVQTHDFLRGIFNKFQLVHTGKIQRPTFGLQIFSSRRVQPVDCSGKFNAHYSTGAKVPASLNLIHMSTKLLQFSTVVYNIIMVTRCRATCFLAGFEKKKYSFPSPSPLPLAPFLVILFRILANNLFQKFRTSETDVFVADSPQVQRLADHIIQMAVIDDWNVSKVIGAGVQISHILVYNIL